MTRFEPRTMVPGETILSFMHAPALSGRLATALAGAGLALVLLAGRPTHAAEISVTSTSGARGGPGCTLRDAITAANTDTATGGCPAGNGADTITLTAGATYTLTEVDNTGVNNGPTTASLTPTATATVPAVATPRFVENGDGTVTDRQTGLMWEQKTGTFDPYSAGVDCSITTCSDPRNVNNQYAWSASGTVPDGGAFTDFLPRVNGTLCSASPCTGLGGHSDWRLPTIWELHAILDLDPTASACGPGSVCIDQAFGPTAWGNLYWSATTYADNPALAWGVGFYDGALGADGKTGNNYVRAVRGTTQAPEITVTSASGASGGPGCTLCDAITAAKTDLAFGGCPPGSGADTIIVIAGARYTLTQLDEVVTACTGIPQSNGLPSVTSDITIIGNGATIARSDAPGTPAFRLLHVAPGGRLTINDLRLTNGKMPDADLTRPSPGGDGGGILNEGVLTLINVVVTANSAGNTGMKDAPVNPLAGCAGRGGGVFNAGTLTLAGSIVSGNTAGYDDGDWGKCAGAGGGIYNDRAAALTLDGSVVSGNTAGYDGEGDGGAGGGIFNAGSAVVAGSSITSNAAGKADNDNGGNGGGIANGDGGTLKLIDSTISNNSAGPGDSFGGDGGGIFNSGTVMLTRCTVSGNSSGYGGQGCSSGGGIANAYNGMLTLVNSTVSGNQASGYICSGDGGGIFNTGNMLLASCTISGNSAGEDWYTIPPGGKGGGIATAGPLAVLKNTLIANNSIGGDCDGVLTSQGFNLVQDPSNCTLTGDTTGNITNVDPHLGPLQGNGGATETQALLSGSPAIDAGNPNSCTDADGNVLTTDQRGAPRAVAGDDRCDIGAYEATLPEWATITPTPTSTPAPTPTPTATVPTPTSTSAPTATVSTPTPTSGQCGQGTACLWVGSATGAPGARVTFAVTLLPEGLSIAATQNDITFTQMTAVAANADGTPDCAVNPLINREATAFAFLPHGCSPGVDCQAIRAIVLSATSLEAISPDAVLYQCAVDIAGDAAPGRYPLMNSNALAADPLANPKELIAMSGEIVVEAPGALDPPAASAGCSLAPGRDHARGTWLALLLVAGLLARRRAGRLATSSRLLGVVIATGLGLALPPGRPTHAAEISVSSTSGARGGRGCTLRDAITAANTDAATGGCPAGSGTDIITLTAGATYTLTEVDNTGVRSGIAEPNGLPSVTSDITISGNGGGCGDAEGGYGGGIYNTGAAELIRCTVSGNNAGYGTGDGSGGGIANGEGGAFTLTNSTVSGNQAGNYGGEGGGIFNAGSVVIASCTISANSITGTSDSGTGSGLVNAGPLAAVRNTLIAGNSSAPEWSQAVPDDCYGVLTSQGYNLIQDTSDCNSTGDTTGNITDVDPRLGPLQSNGGVTETQALLLGSPAIDAGNPNGCTDPDGNILTTDQRGAPRALDGDARCDIGAYEATLPAWATITPTPTATTPPTPTATITPTPTLAPTATPTWAVAVDVGSAAGSPGQQVTVAVFLKSGSQSVAGIQNDIAFDPSTPITGTNDGVPACAVNPAIHKDALFGPRCSALWPHSCSGIRALVFSLDDVSPIPDGSLLYTCSVTISSSAYPGTYVLANSGVIAADPSGHRLPAVGGADGSIVVLSGPTRIGTATASPTPTGTASGPSEASAPMPTSPPTVSGAPAAASAPGAPAGSGGCSLAPERDHGRGTWLALLFVAGFLARRQARGSGSG